MLKTANLQPDLILGETILALTPAILAQYQILGLMLDVDETLVPFRETEPSDRLKQWVEDIGQVASIWLASNNLSFNRIDRIAQSLNLPYIAAARKPSGTKLRRAIAAMNLPPNQIAMVGDRLFTDILAGNRLGMFTILVEPIAIKTYAPPLYSIRNFEVWLSQILGVSLRS